DVGTSGNAGTTGSGGDSSSGQAGDVGTSGNAGTTGQTGTMPGCACEVADRSSGAFNAFALLAGVFFVAFGRRRVKKR
ncbi:MAG TPA: MYXO-CTERM sorting domain-containing protein, partial [Polyangia bacterium]|nr:MYXO-CTERM sorting domain-containing protein [Polyangia bacterium]